MQVTLICKISFQYLNNYSTLMNIMLIGFNHKEAISIMLSTNIVTVNAARSPPMVHVSRKLI